MKLRNIYFSGPDGTSKTTLARGLSQILKTDYGLESRVVSFPSEVGVASYALALFKRGRVRIGPETLNMLFAADRMDILEQILIPQRRENPRLISVSYTHLTLPTTPYV